jgi:hypothetical protein
MRVIPLFLFMHSPPLSDSFYRIPYNFRAGQAAARPAGNFRGFKHEDCMEIIDADTFF